jgi:hypothetical protein
MPTVGLPRRRKSLLGGLGRSQKAVSQAGCPLGREMRELAIAESRKTASGSIASEPVFDLGRPLAPELL